VRVLAEERRSPRLLGHVGRGVQIRYAFSGRLVGMVGCAWLGEAVLRGYVVRWWWGCGSVVIGGLG